MSTPLPSTQYHDYYYGLRRQILGGEGNGIGTIQEEAKEKGRDAAAQYICTAWARRRSN